MGRLTRLLLGAGFAGAVAAGVYYYLDQTAKEAEKEHPEDKDGNKALAPENVKRAADRAYTTIKHSTDEAYTKVKEAIGPKGSQVLDEVSDAAGKVKDTVVASAGRVKDIVESDDEAEEEEPAEEEKPSGDAPASAADSAVAGTEEGRRHFAEDEADLSSSEVVYDETPSSDMVAQGTAEGPDHPLDTSYTTSASAEPAEEAKEDFSSAEDTAKDGVEEFFDDGEN